MFLVTLNYYQAASNVRVAGFQVAELIRVLDSPRSYCVGHSLGAHVCGHAGKRSKLDRITGNN